MPRKEQFRQKPVDGSIHFDEVVAGIFCSKRRTGQFDDRYETGELELTIPIPAAVSAAVDQWDDCLVHDLEKQDFDANDDLMEWPADFDENNDRF